MDKISVGTKLADNDIIETYFQTKVTIKMADGTIVLFGSNSKALLNISSKEIAGRKITEASFSLFNGGMLAKAINMANVIIFTTNAVGTIDSGTLSVIVDAKSGETGFLELGGKAVVRNISQQKGMDLSTGFTTIVIPGRSPHRRSPFRSGMPQFSSISSATSSLPMNCRRRRSSRRTIRAPETTEQPSPLPEARRKNSGPM